jgi:hypothetical protein
MGVRLNQNMERTFDELQQHIPVAGREWNEMLARKQQTILIKFCWWHKFALNPT